MNDETYGTGELVSLEGELIYPPPGTPASPRPADRPRDLSPPTVQGTQLVSFECELVYPPPHTPATPRPPGREREPEPPPAGDKK